MATENVSNCWRSPEGVPSNPERHPFRVTIYFSSNAPGLYGWDCKSQVFATLDEAMAVAAMPMQKGQTSVSVDVAKNRKTWNASTAEGERTAQTGYWEAVGSRKNRAEWRFAKGWSQRRVEEVRAWFNRKGM